jgi:hypothetical protein
MPVISESQYRAMFEAVRHRVLHDPVAVRMDPSWFRNIHNALKRLSRRVARDRNLSSSSKSRLIVREMDVFREAVERMFAAVVIEVEGNLVPQNLQN